ncbi:MAG TPA: family 20 glycosylhydrolase [Bryobacteraceae bacterium]|jgi:hexosaminidase
MIRPTNALFLVAALGLLRAQPALIPIPQSVKACAGEFTFEHLKPDVTPPLSTALARLAATVPLSDSAPQKVSIQIGAGNQEESYTLSIGPDGVYIIAPSPLGAIHAVATLAQLRTDNRYPCIQISDAPRFPWRGLLLDVSRHFMPIDSVKHTLDRMAAVKLNVLHLHLADDQGIRVESHRYPLLQEKASGGQFYTQAQIKDLVAYAQQLGIRIEPEFDFPGHATAWFAAYPELSSAPGPYTIERRIGIFDPAFDPSNPKTYEFIEGFLKEMTTLFPDLYIHLGGDEVNGKQWDANPKIQAFKKSRGLSTDRELQSYFEARMYAIATRLGKKLVLWDEAIHESAPPDITYQAWRGPNALIASAYLQHPTLVSYDFYLDWGLSSRQLYENHLDGILPDETDPILKRLNPLIPIPKSRPPGMLTTLEAAQRLGGEAALWNEFTTPANLDTRLWPRTAVAAERLWSAPENSQNFDDLFRRLYAVFPAPKTKPLEDLLEPGKYVYRHLSHKYTEDSPLDQLVDRLPPESYRAQVFNQAVAKHDLVKARAMLEEWNATEAPQLNPALEADAKRAIKIGLEALNGNAPATASLATLKSLSDNHREIVIAIAPGVTALVNAYAAKSAPQ